MRSLAPPINPLIDGLLRASWSPLGYPCFGTLVWGKLNLVRSLTNDMLQPTLAEAARKDAKA